MRQRLFQYNLCSNGIGSQVFNPNKNRGGCWNPQIHPPTMPGLQRLYPFSAGFWRQFPWDKWSPIFGVRSK
ncbi:hypothetical protein I7I50_10535 [Histoplasma capsulatum G186AR]|uniref:Uncharacterized protein n=1 Tax=Ajellomyces capsulatus TaxID=5037 RepID=A0A8H7Z4G1_AJECA|nr:hypothetical protein I7I52_01774 [Histoplasma capsulatum]QSS69293.1 hypothetical protein I7I50_10535 [Histoplasma capsulatum G186AR]